MNFVVIDLEFNNMRNIPFSVARSNHNCPNEIIQIGAVKLDKYFRVIATLKLYIKPVVYSIMNPNVEEITGISMAELRKGMSFKEAMDMMRAFTDNDSIICSWAKDDPIELIRNAKYHNIKDMCWLNMYVDVQQYCTRVMSEKNILGLKNAMKKLNVSYTEDKLHDALNDCYYTIEVVKQVFNFKAFKDSIIENIFSMSIDAIRGNKDEEVTA
jgi:DNA polymerase III epsilon subunit-like protein